MAYGMGIRYSEPLRGLMGQKTINIIQHFGVVLTALPSFS